LQVLFSSTKAAKFCAEKFNQTTTMGNIMTVFVDVMGWLLLPTVHVV